MNEAFETALEIAVKAHKGQVDKNGVAYILHPLTVAGLLDTLELKTIAVLHDTILVLGTGFMVDMLALSFFNVSIL